MEDSVFPDRGPEPWSPGTAFLDLSVGGTPRAPRPDSRDTSPTMPSGPAPVVSVAALFAPLDEVFPRHPDQGGGGLGGPEPLARGASDGGAGPLGPSPVLPAGSAGTGGAPAVPSTEDTLPPPSPRRAAGAQTKAASPSSPTDAQPRSLASTASVVTGQLVVGADAGGAPRVKVIDAATGSVRLNFLAFANSFHGGVRVATAYVNNDGTPDVIAGQGAGGNNRVRVFNGVTGNAFAGVLGNFQPFSASQSDGVFVASGDVNADGRADIFLGTDVGFVWNELACDEGDVTDAETDASTAACGAACYAEGAIGAAGSASHCAAYALFYEGKQAVEQESQCRLLRDLFGNPFRPVAVDSSWRTATVVGLARAAYDNRTLPEGTLDPGHLAVLADALEDAGCGDAAILGHLRGPGVHVRGCWPVDLVLGKV